MEGTFATEFLFFRLRTFVKPLPRLDMPLSILPCERGRRLNWQMKVGRYYFPSNPVNFAQKFAIVCQSLEADIDEHGL
jgi:hypothetical protein